MENVKTRFAADGLMRKKNASRQETVEQCIPRLSARHLWRLIGDQAEYDIYRNGGPSHFKVESICISIVVASVRFRKQKMANG